MKKKPNGAVASLWAAVLFITLSGNATAQENTCDGPYVFYKGNTVIVHSIINDSVHVDSFPLPGKFKHPLTVRFSNHPDWNFSFTLHKFSIPPSQSRSNRKVICFSDIEGEFEPFRTMLLQNGVVDEHYNWKFGKGVLVIAGDLFDRGKEVIPYLWLLYKLEEEAKVKGGAVHVVLGNHEIMNLSGDTRYVQPKYFQNAAKMHTDYNSLFKENTELGRWLRSKNIIEKIGDLLVLHGGISPVLLSKQWPVDSLNKKARPFYDRSKNTRDDLKDLFNANSPFWYRGYFLDPKASKEEVDSTLHFYRCKKIVVGHDIVDSVTVLYRGKVIGIDVDEHEGAAQGLLIADNHYYIVDKTGKKKKLL